MSQINVRLSDVVTINLSMVMFHGKGLSLFEIQPKRKSNVGSNYQKQQRLGISDWEGVSADLVKKRSFPRSICNGEAASSFFSLRPLKTDK